MTKVKICGNRIPEDVNILNAAKPDYAGFILADSKRKISVDTLRELIGRLDPFIVPVGVFVNQPLEEIMAVVDAGIRVVQLHGDESGEFIAKLKKALPDEVSIWKAIRLAGSVPDLSEYISSNVNALLLDAYSKDAYGGTGERFDWNLINEVKAVFNGPIFVAGGLVPSNVSDAINATSPYGVDVSSGVETDSKKEESLVKAFVDNARGSE